MLHFDVAFILLPVCRNFISVMRRTPLGGVIPFDKNITFRKLTAGLHLSLLKRFHADKSVAWSIVFFTSVHIVAHMVNFTELAISTKTGFVGFIGANCKFLLDCDSLGLTGVSPYGTWSDRMDHDRVSRRHGLLCGSGRGSNQTHALAN